MFQADSTSGVHLAQRILPLFTKYNFQSKCIAFIKGGVGNLTTMATTLNNSVCCELFHSERPFSGDCFAHAMSMACQYATDECKVCSELQISIKETQSALQKTITWPKKSGKGRQTWNLACIENGLTPKKMSTPVKTRFTTKITVYNFHVAQIE